MGNSHLATFIFLRLRLQCYRGRAAAILRTTNVSSSPTWTRAKDWLSRICDSSVCIIITTTTTTHTKSYPCQVSFAHRSNISQLFQPLIFSLPILRLRQASYPILSYSGCFSICGNGKDCCCEFSIQMDFIEEISLRGRWWMCFTSEGVGTTAAVRGLPTPLHPEKATPSSLSISLLLINSLLLIHFLTPYQLLVLIRYPHWLAPGLALHPRDL